MELINVGHTTYHLRKDDNTIGKIIAGLYSIFTVADSYMSSTVKYLHLSDFEVDKKHRNNGYGSFILNEIQKVALKNDEIKLIALYVRPENTIAIGLYRKHGFIEYNYDKVSNTIKMLKFLKPIQSDWKLDKTFS